MKNNTLKEKELTKNLEYIISNLKALNLNKNEAIIGSLAFSIINKNKESIKAALNSKDVDLVHPLENELSMNEVKGIINKYNNKKSVTLLIVTKRPASLDIYYYYKHRDIYYDEQDYDHQTLSPVINLNEKIQIARKDSSYYNATIYTIQVFPSIVGPIEITEGDDLENIMFNETEVKVLKIDSLMATFMNPYASPNGIISDRFIKGIILGIKNPNDLINKENKVGNLFFEVGKRVGDAYNYVNEIRTITKNLVDEGIIRLKGKVDENYYKPEHYLGKLYAQKNAAIYQTKKLSRTLNLNGYGISLDPNEIKYILNDLLKEYFDGVSEGIRKD